MKKKHPEHVNLERWLVSYADFITLLFAFFVVMYAISQADMAKFKAVSASIKAAFSASGAGGILTPGEMGGSNTVNPFDPADTSGGRIMNMPAGRVNTASDPDPELQEMKEMLEETISLELGVSDISDQLRMQFDSRGLVVRLAAKDFFAEGEAAVRPDLRPILDRIGRVLTKTRRLIRVEGHTDAAEASAAGYPSDWELSAARAAWVVKYWMNRFGMDGAKLGVGGHAHYRPLAQTSSQMDPEQAVFARAKNRRIEVIILNNQYETP